MRLITILSSLIILPISNIICQIDSEVLFKSFKQGERTNCASIALIKASLEVFGINNLFLITSSSGDTIKVTLKDNSKVVITAENLKSAEISAGFVLIEDNPQSREIMRYSILTYAIMARYKMDLEKRHKTYQEALEELEYGAFAGDVYKYLGYKRGNQVVRHKRFTGGNLCGLIAWSPAHAVYACNGYMDYYGRKKPLWAKYSGRIQIVKEN